MEWIFFTIILAAVALGFFLVLKTIKKPRDESGGQALGMLQNQINELHRALDSKLESKLGQIANESKHTVSEVSRQSAKIIADVTEKLTRVDEAARQTLAMNEQIKKLQDTLANPKQRGILGEYLLETVLKNVLSPGNYNYQMQYPLGGGIVDAVIFANNKIIPIDSKFSLENYNRFVGADNEQDKKRYESAFVSDIKLRIDETSKYVKPQENTVDFAFMFIPSEAIYYDLLDRKIGSGAENKNLIAYAFQKNVVVVSPNSFLAYLITVLQILRNQEISENAKGIIKQVNNLRKHLISYEEYFGKIGKNLGTTVNAYENARKEFGKIDKDVLRISGEGIGIEPIAIEGPRSEDE